MNDYQIKLNQKLNCAYGCHYDIDDMEKYILRGANIHEDDDRIFASASCSNDIEVMKLLLKYDRKDTIKNNNQIISIAVIHGLDDMINLLAPYVELSNFRHTSGYDKILLAKQK
jgi:hypothetical protein